MLLVFVVSIQLGMLTCENLNVITSYDETRLKATEVIPGADELAAKLYKSFANFTKEDSAEFTKNLKLATETPSWLDSGNIYSCSHCPQAEEY